MPTQTQTEIARLASEHAPESDAAILWLLEHKAQSHASLVELVKAGRLDQQTLGAIFVLGRMGVATDVPLLARLFLNKKDSLQWRSADALAKHVSPEALKVLLEALRSPDATVVAAAASALGERGDAQARHFLEKALDHSDATVRFHVVGALEALGVGGSQQALRARLVRESDPHVKNAIASALKGAP